MLRDEKDGGCGESVNIPFLTKIKIHSDKLLKISC